jgi:hypothetical protein
VIPEEAMGLFDFLKDKGETLFEGDEKEKTVLLLGNVRGILRVDDRLTAEAPEARPERQGSGPVRRACFSLRPLPPLLLRSTRSSP